VHQNNIIFNYYVLWVYGTVVGPTVDKTQEIRLRWLGHVLRREKIEPARLVNEMHVEGKRGRGRRKKGWSDAIEIDTKRAGVSVEDARDRVEWKLRIGVTNSWQRRRRERRKRRFMRYTMLYITNLYCIRLINIDWIIIITGVYMLGKYGCERIYPPWGGGGEDIFLSPERLITWGDYVWNTILLNNYFDIIWICHSFAI